MDARFIDFDGKSVYDKIVELENKGGGGASIKIAEGVVTHTETLYNAPLGFRQFDVDKELPHKASNILGITMMMATNLSQGLTIAGYQILENPLSGKTVLRISLLRLKDGDNFNTQITVRYKYLVN